MKTLLLANHIRGFKIDARDGIVGKAQDFYFDDTNWTIRYVVTDISHWLEDRRVLLSPFSLQKPNWRAKTIPTNLTKEEVLKSPDINTQLPVAGAVERQLHSYFGWNMFWPESLMEMNYAMANSDDGMTFDPHLRSTNILNGISVESKDGSSIGTIHEFVLDSSLWKIPYMLIRRTEGDLILLETSEVEHMDITRRFITLHDPVNMLDESLVGYDPRYTIVVSSESEAKKE